MRSRAIRISLVAELKLFSLVAVPHQGWLSCQRLDIHGPIMAVA